MALAANCFRSVGVVLANIVIGAVGLGFDSRAGQFGFCRQWLAAVATFLGSCVSLPLTITRDALRRNTASIMKICFLTL